LAFDPVNMKQVWRQPLGGARAGVMTTAGNLVFQGALPRGFSAYRADTGERVWTIETQAGIVGGAVSYMDHGTQYVAVVAGTSGFGGGYWAPIYSRLLVYKLDGKAKLPPPAPYTPPVLNPPPEFGDAELVSKGEAQYNAHCASCHGNNTPNGRVSTVFPDLRYAGAIWATDAFKAIVIDGALQKDGMVSFRKMITPQDAESIRAYVVHTANLAKNAPPPPAGLAGGAMGAPAAHGADAAAPANGAAISVGPGASDAQAPSFHSRASIN
jgi:quinohemoprotein ethanol dehydrogenase